MEAVCRSALEKSSVPGPVKWEMDLRVRSTPQGWRWVVGERRLVRRLRAMIVRPERVIVNYCSTVMEDVEFGRGG